MAPIVGPKAPRRYGMAVGELFGDPPSAIAMSQQVQVVVNVTAK
jgi:hypothetical protein